MKYEWHVQGNYGCGWETVVVEETPDTAMEMLATYDHEEPKYPHRIIRVWVD